MGTPANPLHETIIALRTQGMWPAQIARQLGVSRNVVIGACYRAGLSRADVDRRAAAAKGEAHPNAKLTQAQVDDIRASYRPRDKACNQRALAEKYGVDYRTVGAIVRETAWREAA